MPLILILSRGHTFLLPVNVVQCLPILKQTVYHWSQIVQMLTYQFCVCAQMCH